VERHFVRLSAWQPLAESRTEKRFFSGERLQEADLALNGRLRMLHVVPNDLIVDQPMPRETSVNRLINPAYFGRA